MKLFASKGRALKAPLGQRAKPSWELRRQWPGWRMLFDLLDDPAELHPLAPDTPRSRALASSLQKRLLEWLHTHLSEAQHKSTPSRQVLALVLANTSSIVLVGGGNQTAQGGEPALHKESHTNPRRHIR